MWMMILGIAMIGAASVLDMRFRLRMKETGNKWAILKGGAFNDREYHKLRREHGWAAWPVYVMWTLMFCGLLLLVMGFFSEFGTSRARKTLNVSSRGIFE